MDVYIILKFATSISAFIALIGLIYQIIKDINAKRSKYKLKITVTKSSTKGKLNTYTINIRNIGNRTLNIEKIGKVYKYNKKELFKIKQLNSSLTIRPYDILVFRFSMINIDSEYIGVQDTENRFHLSNNLKGNILYKSLNLILMILKKFKLIIKRSRI